MELRFAVKADVEIIVEFIRQNWNKDHVYVRRPDMLLYDFEKNDSLNFGLLEINGELHGIFGYFFYNEDELPDIGGMIWKVTDTANKTMPLAGFALRDYVISNVRHRFYGSPGAGKQTENIYKVLGMDWITMDHFYGIAASHKWPGFLTGATSSEIQAVSDIKVEQITCASDLTDSVVELLNVQTPRKSPEYIVKRYIDNPYRTYQLWLCSAPGWSTLVVTRNQASQGVEIMRIIDVLGPPKFAAKAISAVYHASKHRVAYVDFVCSGFDSSTFYKQGFDKVDFQDELQAIPNLFEPYVAASNCLYAQATPGFDNVTMVKGNGDQDRPNFNSP